MQTRAYIRELNKYIGQEVLIKGWVSVRRDHGKLIFLDVRDITGKIQTVALPNHKEAHDIAEKLRSEWVVELKGKVNKRPEKMINKEEENGHLEIEIYHINVLNQTDTLPIDVGGDGRDIGENARLKYRYLDLRRPRMQKNIRNRHRVMQFVRNWFSKEGFVEIETPSMSATTPEGSRDFIIPSRLDKGKFYSLPQSPQQYKQLLMSAGFEKYFQFARCYRDEDTRGDRQPEFTQMDMEMSFVTREEVMDINEKALIALVKEIYPYKKIQQIPFPRISYKEALTKYGSDKPDLRNDKEDKDLLAFEWIVDWPFFERDDLGKWTFSHNPFSAPIPEHMDWLLQQKNIPEIITTQYDIVLNGYEIGGGSIRNHRPEALKAVFKIMGYDADRIEKNFGHMLRAFSLGTPPHGGIAWGFDRLMMLLENEPNIREVIAFAKTGEGRDLMMNAPSEVPAEQLLELGIKIIENENVKNIKSAE
jgi:aspartyl-tRNA synthetase